MMYRGLTAGLLAGLILAALNFVTDSTPGRTLPETARWFGLTFSDGTTSRIVGFVLLLVLGALFGLLFGVLQRDKEISLSRAIVTGLVLGVAWWLVFALILGNIMRHASPFQLNFGSFLSTFPLYLLFGLFLGTIYFYREARGKS